MLVVVEHFLIEVEPRYGNDLLYIPLIELDVLYSLWLDQLKSELESWCKDHLSATISEIQDAAERIQEDMRITIPDPPDPILSEAIAISKERIITKLAAERLNIEPNNLTLHATELAQREDIRALAKIRVQAKLRAGREMFL